MLLLGMSSGHPSLSDGSKKLVPLAARHVQRTAVLQSRLATPCQAWREKRMVDYMDNEPCMMTHKFVITNLVAEKAIFANPTMARELGVRYFHRAYKLNADRQLRSPVVRPQHPQLPETALLNNADKFEGTMAPYVFGVVDSISAEEDDHFFGSAFLLSPCMQASDSNKQVVYLGTAMHNLLAPCKHMFGAMIEPPDSPFRMKSNLVELTPGNVYDGWTLSETAREVWRVMAADGPPKPKSCDATVAYPALEIPVGSAPTPIRFSPDIAIVQVDAHGGFPYDAKQDWYPTIKRDWLVPAYIPSEELVGNFITIAGVAGSITDLKQIQQMYGAPDEAAASSLADELQRVALPPGQLLLSPGNVIADNGLFLYHRASAHIGMSGSAVRSISHPQLLLGTHIGTDYRFAYNIATSVNHPKWCALYVQYVLPALVAVQDNDWPAEYMASSLAGYLRYHQEALEMMGLWEQHAKSFVIKHTA